MLTDIEEWMKPEAYQVQIRIRPRWKRLLLAPRTFIRYRRAGCRWRHALSFVWLTVI